MAKPKSAFENAANTFEDKGKREWAKAKAMEKEGNSDAGYAFNSAKKSFDTAKRARESAEKAK